MKRRENTFCIDYSAVTKKPSYEELHQFIGTQLGLKREEVQRIQCSRSTGCAFVKVVDLELAQKIVTEHDNKHEIVADGQVFALRLRMEDGAVSVKLFDLTEGTTSEQIVEYLSAYGEVITIQPEVWSEKFMFGGLATGVWVVKMMVTRNIPSYVTIDGDTTYLSYFGQRQTCRHCGEYVHNGTSCVQNKKLLMQKISVDSAKPTYANVTKAPTSSASSTYTKKPPGGGPSTRSTGNSQPTFVAQTSTSTNTTTTERPADTEQFSGQSMPRRHVPSQADSSISNSTQTSELQTLALPVTAPTYAFRTPRLPNVIEDRTKKSTKINDEDTDDSSTSNNSRRSHGRPPGKKQKHGTGVDLFGDTKNA